LLSNALKYSSPDRKPEVKIVSYQEKEFTILQVSDNGLGLSKENQSKIFGMFKRVHQHVEGSGIGLYIIKKMIENVGGKIEVKSEVGKGTTFKVVLPS
jgi:signal transduction histidine kinase